MFDQAPGDVRLRNAFLIASAIAWCLLLLMPPGTVHACPAVGTMSRDASLAMLVAMNPPGRLATGWLLMLAAMMSPVLIAPACYVRQRSISRRRVRAILLFVAGYTVWWTAVGAVLTTVVLGLRSLNRGPYELVVAGAAIALVWQFSPMKQYSMNQCHSDPRLGTFGTRADIDALKQGIVHGFWCAGSCWALMLLPMLLPSGHNVAMAFVALIMFAERLDHPASPSWRLRVPARLLRVVVARARIRGNPLRFGPR